VHARRGVPNYPDQQTTPGGIGVPSGFTFDTSNKNLDQKSPQYQACQGGVAQALADPVGQRNVILYDQHPHMHILRLTR
jgi:hypothetical protein